MTEEEALRPPPLYTVMFYYMHSKGARLCRFFLQNAVTNIRMECTLMTIYGLDTMVALEKRSFEADDVETDMMEFDAGTAETTDPVDVDDEVAETGEMLGAIESLEGLHFLISKEGLTPTNVAVFNTDGLLSTVTHNVFPSIESIGNASFAADSPEAKAAMEAIVDKVKGAVGGFFEKVASMAKSLTDKAVNFVKSMVAKVTGLFKKAETAEVDENKEVEAGMSADSAKKSIAIIAGVAAAIVAIIALSLPGSRAAMLTFGGQVVSKINGLVAKGVASVSAGGKVVINKFGSWGSAAIGAAKKGSAKTLGWAKGGIKGIGAALAKAGQSVWKALMSAGSWIATQAGKAKTLAGDALAAARRGLVTVGSTIWGLIRRVAGGAMAMLRKAYYTVTGFVKGAAAGGVAGAKGAPAA